MITFTDVSKSYDGRKVVDGLSIEIAAGSICVIVGPSGCGKSTTLRMINGLIQANEGEITVDGQNVASTDPAELRRGIGYVIQSGGLFPHWSIADNIATVPRLLGWPKDKVSARVAELVKLVGLDAHDIARRRPHELSGGQQQRVGVARALAADPPILLMDEPFGALDPVTRRSLQDELLAIQRAMAKTIVLVTHDMDEALKLADRIIVLENGRIVQDGSPAAIAMQPATDLVRAFVGEEATLHLLSRGTVAEVMGPPTESEDGPAIEQTATLSAALSCMVAQASDRLDVRDEAGRRVGSVALADLSPTKTA